MKKLISVALLILLTLVFAFNANAHPGRTDSDGGHYDRNTGEYHYHHGRPAHDHPNGKCPYDDEDIYEYNFSYTETTADSPQWDDDIYEESSSYTETTVAPIQTTDSPQRDDETYEESFSNIETTAAPIQTANSSQWEKVSYFLYPILVSILACIVIVSFYILLFILAYKIREKVGPCIKKNAGKCMALVFIFVVFYAVLFSTSSVTIMGVVEFGYTFFINMFIPIICICAFRQMDTPLILMTCLINSVLTCFYFMHDINLQGGSYSILSAFAWFCASFLFLYWIFRNRD